MKRFFNIGMALFLVAFMCASCKPGESVRAGSEGEYQPLPAPGTEGYARKDAANPEPDPVPVPTAAEIEGELTRIDMTDKRMFLRLENGMEQTVKWTDDTMVTGIPASSYKKAPTTAANMKLLAAKPGSEIVVEWVDENGLKVATAIDVTHMVARPRKR